MEVVNMRTWLKKAYSGPRWQKMVDKMKDDQVMAIYYDMVKRGKIKGA